MIAFHENSNQQSKGLIPNRRFGESENRSLSREMSIPKSRTCPFVMSHFYPTCHCVRGC
jgi:hypothetical protein